jgi:hypothetical protein
MKNGITCMSHGVRERQMSQRTGEKASGVEAPAILPMEETMKVPTAGTRRGKRSKTTKARSQGKAAKQATRKKEKAPHEPQVVFAFRLTRSDRERIHDAAGAGKATRFVRAAALAAAADDTKAFQELAAQAKANLK